MYTCTDTTTLVRLCLAGGTPATRSPSRDLSLRRVIPLPSARRRQSACFPVAPGEGLGGGQALVRMRVCWCARACVLFGSASVFTETRSRSYAGATYYITSHTQEIHLASAGTTQQVGRKAKC